MATDAGRPVLGFVRVFTVDFSWALFSCFVTVFDDFDTFLGSFPRKYNVLGVSAIGFNTSVNPCSRGEIWLIFVKISEKSVDIIFLLCYN